MAQQPSQPVLVEYFIQNDQNDTDAKKNPYPNIFILPKKYASINDVRVADVVEGFPMNDGHKYQIRFETQV